MRKETFFRTGLTVIMVLGLALMCLASTNFLIMDKTDVLNGVLIKRCLNSYSSATNGIIVRDTLIDGSGIKLDSCKLRMDEIKGREVNRIGYTIKVVEINEQDTMVNILYGRQYNGEWITISTDTMLNGASYDTSVTIAEWDADSMSYNRYYEYTDSLYQTGGALATDCVAVEFNWWAD